MSSSTGLRATVSRVPASLEDIPTPALVLDRQAFEDNILRMQRHATQSGVALRPHFKVHKCIDVARRQLEAGAIGVSAATLAECELLVAGGIGDILLTTQPAGRLAISRTAALAAADPGFQVAVDDVRILDQLNEAAGRVGIRITVLVDVDAGMQRQGVAKGADALSLGHQAMRAPNLRLAGLMCYSGAAAHTHGFEARTQRSLSDLAGGVEARHLFHAAGLPDDVLSGGSTGTYNIDTTTLTELQCGSYVFMDTDYLKIGGVGNAAEFTDFSSALFVLTTVISALRPGKASIDAGGKAQLQPSDRVVGRADLSMRVVGAEYGQVEWSDGDGVRLGQRLQLLPTRLDMLTSAFDRIYVCDDGRVVDIWSIMGRAGAPQR